MTFREYAEMWRAGQVQRRSSAAHVETMLRRHAYPALGDKPLSEIRPSEVQAWAKGLPVTLAPSTVAVVHGIVAAVFKAAIRDRKVMGSPCDGTKLPKSAPREVEPLTTSTGSSCSCRARRRSWGLRKRPRPVSERAARVVVEALSAHLAGFPAVEQEILCRDTGAKTWHETVALVFTDDHGKPVRRTAFSPSGGGRSGRPAHRRTRRFTI
jgi:hypothetical protein